MPFFSVIIPVYKVELYLRKCIESVQNQVYQNFEIILVDDGSPDHCPEICDEYALQDSRIKVIHKENGGQSSARNVGLKLAQGDYILFLDSDDYWEGKDFLYQLSEKLRIKCDICFYGCYDEFSDTGKRIKSRGNYDEAIFQTGNKDEILYSLFIEEQFPGACWIFCVRRALLEEHAISFIEGNRAEDIDWLLNVLSVAQTFVNLNICPYIYLKNRPNSISGTAGLHSVDGILTTIKKWSRRLKKEQTGKTYLALNAYLVHAFFTAVILYHKLEHKERKKIKNMIQDIELDLKNIIGKKVILCSKFYKIFGVDITSALLNVLRNMRK